MLISTQPTVKDYSNFLIKYNHLPQNASTTTYSIQPWHLPDALPTLLLYSYSHFRAPGSLTLKPADDVYVLIYQQSGHSLLQLTKDEIYTMNTGSFLLYPLTSPITLTPQLQETAEFHLVILRGATVRALYSLYRERGASCLFTPTTCSATSLLDSLLLHIPFDTMSAQIESSSILHQLLTALVTEQQQYKDSKDSVPSYIHAILHLFDTAYENTYNLQELCETYHISKCKLTKDFQRYLNDSPINYLLKRRLEVAKNLLLVTDDSICSIAQQVGIRNTNHFTNLFKKNIGQTPNQYRKDHKCK